MDQHLTVKELSKKLGDRSRSAIYEDVKHGRLPQPLRLGGRIYWPESEVDSHLRSLRDAASREDAAA